MHRLSTLYTRQPAAASAFFKANSIQAAAATTTPSFYNMQAMFFANTQMKQKESPRERELRRRELSGLMEKWRCTVGFEFHVQMNTKHKMFSSKYKCLIFAIAQARGRERLF